MSPRPWEHPSVQTWTDDHRAHVGALVAAEITRQGLSASAAASKAGVSTKTLDRVRKGDTSVTPATIVAVAGRLGLPLDAVRPPRDAGEQTQLDRIESMLTALLAHHGVMPSDDAVVATVEAEAQRRDHQQPSPAPASTRKPGKGRAA
jgi:transcriptional regulator with XRE-family HTH domain